MFMQRPSPYMNCYGLLDFLSSLALVALVKKLVLITAY